MQRQTKDGRKHERKCEFLPARSQAPCLSVTSRSSITKAARIELVFGISYPVLWLGSQVVSVLDSGGADGPGFKSQPQRCRVTVLGKLFIPIVPLFTKQRIGSSPLKVNAGLAESNGSLPPGL